MATPRVFISSTCYDLAEVRDGLVSFIRSFGFEPALSERGDIFYHPDFHTHDSCISEISNCELFILIIGGRFGGSYNMDIKKSIVNAEYMAARDLNVPVFTFIKQEVLDDHRLYLKNVSKSILGKIEFPSIEKNEHAVHIFEFIDLVRQAKVNNGFFPFRYASEIHDILRKQWSGMFFDFLNERNLKQQYENTSNVLSNLDAASKKIEEIVKNIYRQVDDVKADGVLDKIELESKADLFFKHIVEKLTKTSHFLTPLDAEAHAELDVNNEWYEYIALFEDFENIEDVEADDGHKSNFIVYSPAKFGIGYYGPDVNNKLNAILEDSFQAYKSLPVEKRREMLAKHVAHF